MSVSGTLATQKKSYPVLVLGVLIAPSGTACILQQASSAHAVIEFQLDLAIITTEQYFNAAF